MVLDLPSQCTPAKEDANSFECARLIYDLSWSFEAKSAVIAWEANSEAFDAMNRYLWDNKFANGTQGKDPTGNEI